MTCDELKAAINSEIAQNARIAAIRSRMDAGTANFLDSELYTAITAEITAEQMRRNVLALSDREPAFVDVVRERYTDTFATFNAVQRILDALTGIRIRTVQPEFENDRAHKIGHSLNDPTVPDSVIERRAYSATENFVRSQHDRCTKANASFRSRAGLDCRITRTGGAKCCDWCASVSGSFTTGNAPDGIWGRHDNCKCSITYETRRGSFQQLSGSGKGWDTVEELPDIPLRVLTGETTGAGEVHAVSAGQAAETAKKMGLHVNQSRAIDMINDYGVPSGAPITAKDIIDDLGTSDIGREILSYMENLPERIMLDYHTVKLDVDGIPIRGEEDKGRITIYLLACENAERASRTIIHECTHYRYKIGNTQRAECVCFAQELKHKYKRNDLTYDEFKRIIKAVKAGYPDLPWDIRGEKNERKS